MNASLITSNDKPATALAELSAGEEIRLVALENAIEDYLKSFKQIGRCLSQIRDEKLYRATHKTFEAYCSERWAFKMRRAYQLIDASVAAENVQHVAQKPNARQASELAKAPNDQQPEIWEQVVEQNGEKVTAAKVRGAVELLNGAPKTNGRPKKPPSKSERALKIFSTMTECEKKAHHLKEGYDPVLIEARRKKIKKTYRKKDGVPRIDESALSFCYQADDYIHRVVTNHGPESHQGWLSTADQDVLKDIVCVLNKIKKDAAALSKFFASKVK